MMFYPSNRERRCTYPELAKAAATDCSQGRGRRLIRSEDRTGGRRVWKVVVDIGQSARNVRNAAAPSPASAAVHFVPRTLRDHVYLVPGVAPWHGSPRSLGASKPQRPILLGRRSRSEPKPVAPECLGEFEHDQNNCRCAQRQAEIVPVQPAEAEQAPHGGH